VGVYQDGYTVNDIPVTLDKLDAALGKVASIDTGQTIMITVSAVSKHGMLVKVLDLCAKNNLRSLSVVSASN
jgi:biopolymer transport protein ExbD